MFWILKASHQANEPICTFICYIFPRYQSSSSSFKDFRIFKLLKLLPAKYLLKCLNERLDCICSFLASGSAPYGCIVSTDDASKVEEVVGKSF
ncbi:unnamed protein product [Lactuca virosa]|uniref:Uncharacterized protein n=1 Tax=Lactuca virosa TaxID=75947 RepID=A0AAU9N378_9ASTR|nr:unnamed protein product [Lactuca virosa]